MYRNGQQDIFVLYEVFVIVNIEHLRRVGYVAKQTLNGNECCWLVDCGGHLNDDDSHP